MDDAKARDMEFWRALHAALQNARRTLPYVSEPDRVYWDHPDDDWKNDAAVHALENECSADSDDLIRHYCLKQAWPKRSKNNARFFAGKRIKWALAFVRVLTIPVQATGTAAIPRPPQSGWELLQWLLIHAYHERFPPPPPEARLTVCDPNPGLTTI
jgi:hypothetical protein